MWGMGPPQHLSVFPEKESAMSVTKDKEMSAGDNLS